jgi:small subunit ribosomal protein S17
MKQESHVFRRCEYHKDKLNVEKRRHRKIRTGTVVSNRMAKTVSVAIVRSYQHPLYKKVVRSTKKILAHDEQNNCNIGDVVQVIESRPLSRHKRWRVQSIISAAQSATD